MKKLQKRFSKRDGTIHNICAYGCLCSCAAIGCEFNPETIAHRKNYDNNYTSTKRLMVAK